MTKRKETGSDTHRATARGYAAGRIIEAGEMVPAGITVSDEWMEPVSRREAALTGALEEALDPHGADVNVEELKGAALTAYAASLEINRGDLNDKDLRAAVTAKRQPTA